MLGKVRNPRENKRVKTVKSLPSEFRLGVWGSSGAGKTTYMTMLYQEFESLSDWTILPANDEADKFILKNYRKIVEGQFPDRTSVDQKEKLKIHSYQLSQNSGNKNSITLNFIDAPGEYYESIKTNLKVEDLSQPDQEIDIIDYLMNCDGIIFLLDPDPDGNNKVKDANNKVKDANNKVKEEYSIMLRQLFFEFNKRSRKNNKISKRSIEQYIAFCITKTDHDEIWQKALDQDADEYIKDLIAPMMTLTSLANYMYLELDKEKRKERTQNNRCQFFYTSSLGRCQQNGKSHSIYIPDKTSNTEPEPEPEPDTSSGWGSDEDYTWNNNSEKSNPKSQDIDDPYGPTQSDANPLPPKAPGGRIKPGIRLNPSNVYEPVLWLIEGISLYPPNRQ